MSKRVAREQVLVRPTGADPAFEAPPFFKQKTAYEILRSDWSSDVCSSD
eukprot:COSAG01_NODE_65119_length_274_cov_0.594286_1_plen_48_part_01